MTSQVVKSVPLTRARSSGSVLCTAWLSVTWEFDGNASSSALSIKSASLGTDPRKRCFNMLSR